MNLRKMVDATPQTAFALTPREDEVMRCLAKGMLDKEIADVLGISFSAVRQRVHNIFRKYRVGNRTEAVIKWTSEKTEVRQAVAPIYERSI